MKRYALVLTLVAASLASTVPVDAAARRHRSEARQAPPHSRVDQTGSLGGPSYPAPGYQPRGVITSTTPNQWGNLGGPAAGGGGTGGGGP